MTRELLYKFFEGKTSFVEEKQIKEWIESSETNFNDLLKYRKEYDIQLISNRDSINNDQNNSSLKKWMAIAAAILILVVGGIYLFNSSDKTENYNTLIVPPGQRINLILSDNSNIWLNANTVFKYPTKFSKQNRTVHLDGEAYFEVSKNKEKPFIVKTQKGDIHVTGTSFNVEAYSKFNNFETSLFEGGVDIYNNDMILASLKPNEKASLDNNKLFLSTITNTDQYLWKEGLIAFNNEKLEDIIINLEKYFDVEIKIETTNIPTLTYTGKFRQSDGVDYALRVLQKSINFTYERDEESGIIKIK